MDQLLKMLSDSKAGCYICHNFVGSVSCADDLTLIALTLCATKQMIQVCGQFSVEYNVHFKAAQSTMLVFDSLLVDRIADVVFSGKTRQSTAVPLGISIGQDDHKAISNLYYRVSKLIKDFHFCHFDVTCKLFSFFCTSYDGCPL